MRALAQSLPPAHSASALPQQPAAPAPVPLVAQPLQQPVPAAPFPYGGPAQAVAYPTQPAVTPMMAVAASAPLRVQVGPRPLRDAERRFRLVQILVVAAMVGYLIFDHFQRSIEMSRLKKDVMEGLAALEQFMASQPQNGAAAQDAIPATPATSPSLSGGTISISPQTQPAQPPTASSADIGLKPPQPQPAEPAAETPAPAEETIRPLMAPRLRLSAP